MRVVMETSLHNGKSNPATRLASCERQLSYRSLLSALTYEQELPQLDENTSILHFVCNAANQKGKKKKRPRTTQSVCEDPREMEVYLLLAVR